MEKYTVIDGYTVNDRYTANDSKGGTILGIIFFSGWVIFAYRLNTYFLNGEAMTGGRLFWRNYGWSILCSIPFVGWIYGFSKLNDIVDTRNKIAALNLGS
ncbi:MAG: hypothetical protein LBS90_05795 [Oscillospiraceae bacterium]|jgi:hypothetical protein|nr:hypothetical protein [Oscillospiraceae bacterium]